jgi:hypothetical protein
VWLLVVREPQDLFKETDMVKSSVQVPVQVGACEIREVTLAG